MIPRQIAAAFHSGVRARGDEYVSQRRVRITGAATDRIAALVSGTSSYTVQLSAERGNIAAMCDCPYAAEHGVCKHLWAVLRFADTNGQLNPLLQTAGRNPNLVAFRTEGVDDLWADDADDNIDDVLPFVREWLPPARQPTPPPRANRQVAPPPRPPSPPVWKSLLESARRQMEVPGFGRDVSHEWPRDVRVVYIIDLAPTRSSPGIVIELATEKLGKDGAWEAPVQFRYSKDTWRRIPDENDRRIAQMLMGSTQDPYTSHMRPGSFVLTGPAIEISLRDICETGRCRVRNDRGERPTEPVSFDTGDAWMLHLRVLPDAPGTFVLDATLRRAGEEMMLSEAMLLHASGILFARGTFARFDHAGAFVLIPIFAEKKRLVVRAAELPSLLESLYALPKRPPMEVPAHANVSEVRAAPRRGVIIHGDPSPWRATHRRLELFFEYGTRRLTGDEEKTSLFDRETLTVHHRDLDVERGARERLVELGAREEWHYGENGKCLSLHGNKVMRLVGELATEGWLVEADGAVFRSASGTRASVSSGIDWFELSAGIRYGDFEVSLLDLLAARKAGETTVVLADGSRGIIPQALLGRLGPLMAGGVAANGSLRFLKSQTALLDAMLAVLPEPDTDATFEKARAELRAFDHIEPFDPPDTFRGTLRHYQKEGLGWFKFLRTFGLGGCLADDMGLGKTVQVLALLESRRLERASKGTRRTSAPARLSIVVVPRSLVFNWRREAERFTPELRMLDWAGPGRSIDDLDPTKTDVVLTTYGTLRRDATTLAGIDFDYAILDEAQAIKSAGSASAKAARLLRADHRLAMTGTPIENRLEELWSLFEFLNPGMLGASTAFAALARLSRTPEGTEAPDRGILSRALRPVILRRTKTQVAPELPAKMEQTLSVDLEGPQRKFYDGVLETYRTSVLERVERVGMAKSRMHILEALLRLRQAACHPVLVDPKRHAAPSAKLDALIPTLEEVIAEGHKALVFSQFTSFLALVRARLDATETPYEYLDGSTRDRQACVDRFQNDASCSVFLISLKAGGHGLNLTAAEYVFILDPWWNPAVEAQAIDRAHRIGQTNRVIATRIVARDTIEEKILELQASKRALADAILGQDEGLLSQIGREDLALLFG